MTLLLTSFVCDWCDGLLIEWEEEPITKPIIHPQRSDLFVGDSTFSHDNIPYDSAGAYDDIDWDSEFD